MPQALSTILRDRLVSEIDARWQGGLGVVIGGAGLGKSTLIRQAVFESATLGRGSETVIRCRPDWTATSLHGALCRQLAVDFASDDPAESVAEYLWSAAPGRVGIVLDDLHLLDESGIAYALDLRRAMPSNAHMLIATRENTLLTALLMTADPMFVVDGAQLLFTNEEVAAFAAESGTDETSLQRAGGWPAVLALTASAGPDVAGAYLYQKVLAGLSRRQQGDLAIAASLGEVNADLAGRVLEGQVADLANIPLVDTPSGGGVIVHDLWREPLEGLVDADRLYEAQRAAADLAEFEGDVDRAVSILSQASLTEQARKVILRHIAAGADRVPVDRIDRWLRVVNSPDQALLLQTLQLLRSGLISGSLSDLALDEITERCQQAGELDLEALVCEIRFATSWSADDTASCVAVAERLVELHELGLNEAAHGEYMRDVTIARSERDNERVLEVIAAARENVGTFVGPDWNTSLELETLVALGRPFEALRVLEATESRLAERKIRSVTYGLTYWFCGRADDGLRSLTEILREPGRFAGLERSWRATRTLFRAYRGLDIVGGLADVTGEDERFSTYSRVCEGLSQIAQDLHAGDEAKAAESTRALAERLPPTGGFTIQAWFMGAAMWYVLIPEDRPLLDSFMTGDIYGQAGALVQAFVASRETDTIPDELVRQLPLPEQIGTILPARWAAEFALRLQPDHPELAAAILGHLEAAGRPTLELLAAGSDELVAASAATALRSRPRLPDAPVVARLFGQPALDVPGHGEQPDWRRGRVRALLGFLATRGPVTREAAIDALWPDLDASAGRKNLRVTLSYLTKALEPDRGRSTPPWFVQADGETLRLNTQGLELDVTKMQSALAAALEHQRSGVASKSIEALDAAVGCYRGPFLADTDDEWAIEERMLFERQTVNGCLRLAALLHAGRSPDAVTYVRRAIEIDPLSVDACELLVEVLAGGPAHEIDAARAQLRAVLDATS